MTEKEIFTHLFEIAKTSQDPEDVVVACICKDGKIIVSSASSDDSIHHAEYLVIKKVQNQKIKLDEQYILYTTLEPCSDLPNINDGRDCTTVIIESGIKKIVFGAKDPEYSTKATIRFQNAGISCVQVNDLSLADKSKVIFNSTIKKDLNSFKLPRKKVL